MNFSTKFGFNKSLLKMKQKNEIAQGRRWPKAGYVPLHVRNTCAKYMCKTHVQNTCAKHMCKIHVQNTCAKHMCKIHVQNTCLKYL